MKRYTHNKNEEGNHCFCRPLNDDKTDLIDEDTLLQLVANKLGALEDIEQELGIDLITLFKALFIEQDFYFLVGDEMHSIRDNYYRVHILMDKSFEISLDNECIGWYLFKDYGKTWDNGGHKYDTTYTNIHWGVSTKNPDGTNIVEQK